MVKKGDTIEDVIKYVKFRIQHLRLEWEKVPYYVPKDKIFQDIVTTMGVPQTRY